MRPVGLKTDRPPTGTARGLFQPTACPRQHAVLARGRESALSLLNHRARDNKATPLVKGLVPRSHQFCPTLRQPGSRGLILDPMAFHGEARDLAERLSTMPIHLAQLHFQVLSLLGTLIQDGRPDGGRTDPTSLASSPKAQAKACAKQCRAPSEKPNQPGLEAERPAPPREECGQSQQAPCNTRPETLTRSPTWRWLRVRQGLQLRPRSRKLCPGKPQPFGLGFGDMPSGLTVRIDLELPGCLRLCHHQAGEICIESSHQAGATRPRNSLSLFRKVRYDDGRGNAASMRRPQDLVTQGWFSQGLQGLQVLKAKGVHRGVDRTIHRTEKIRKATWR
jgi:hypothetical protein